MKSSSISAPAARSVGTTLAILLAPTPALADGLGGLGGAQAMALAALGMFALAWIVVWAAYRGYRRLRMRNIESGAQSTYWLKDRTIPLGLRILGAAQYFMAFGLAASSLMLLMFPYARQNGQIANFLIHNIVMGGVFALLSMKVANGIIRCSNRWGYKGGMWLGALAIVNPCVYWLAYGGFGREFGPDWMSAILGATLIILLYTRYRSYFGAKPVELHKSRFFKGAMWVLSVTAIAAAIGVVLLLSYSFVYTSGDHEKADQTIRDMSVAIKQYRAEHGEWPGTLEDIDPSVQRHYQQQPILYDREALTLWLDVNLEYVGPDASSSLLYRFSFGRLGRTGDLVGGMGIDLDYQPP